MYGVNTNNVSYIVNSRNYSAIFFCNHQQSTNSLHSSSTVYSYLFLCGWCSNLLLCASHISYPHCNGRILAANSTHLSYMVVIISTYHINTLIYSWIFGVSVRTLEDSIALRGDFTILTL